MSDSYNGRNGPAVNRRARRRQDRRVKHIRQSEHNWLDVDALRERLGLPPESRTSEFGHGLDSTGLTG